MPEERIGLLGGTFNPIHLGHLRAAEEIEEKFSLAAVLFIPSYIPPHKLTTEIAAPADRLAMVKLAVQGWPRFAASSIEIEARETSYSITTIDKVKRAYQDAWLFFIVGVDAFLEIETWKSYREVLEQCRFIVVSRPGYSLGQAKKVLPGEYRDKILDARGLGRVGQSSIRKNQIFLVDIQALDISSTEIRRRIRRGEPIKGLVPEAVEEYINNNRLYQE
ncbi:MAG: nicotinate-nucleotide adenylyltransferase [Clostridiales bacterium]|nr:nicotinate-nucleotide adenylyltransferase [Clostridiales bacterium]